MRPRLVVRRAALTTPRTNPRSPRIRAFANQSQLTATKARPSLPFLLVPTASSNVRHFTSARRQWLRHEARLVFRYTVAIWGTLVCLGVIFFAVSEEVLEREFPTPHEWDFMTRKFLRDANKYRDPKSGQVNWARTLELAREVLIRLEKDPAATKLSDREDPSLEDPGEFINRDISAMSEEWRRGYFDTIMLAAKAAEHVDGWVRDVSRNLVSPPEFVLGPSNPRPAPIPPGNPHAPREEDSVLAYPSADNWYMKILATGGFSPRQKMEAALEYATFMEFKQRPEGPDALYNLALAEATTGLEPSKLPYDPKTLVLRYEAGPPSLNVIDTITAIANHKARKGDVSRALPIYLSLFKARRSLADKPPRTPPPQPKRIPWYRSILNFFAPPDYPPPPPDGTQPPWRSPEERCHEASLNLYIGEILYATSSSREDGVAWTRDAVDAAEEQLRALGEQRQDKGPRRTCRECLGAGLDNWSTMVARLAREEVARKEAAAGGSKSGVFSFWGGAQEVEGRWAAEEAVVQERIRRTQELMQDVTPPVPGVSSLYKA